MRCFDGDLIKWMGFWQSFEVAVNNNDDLSGVKKFNYRISSNKSLPQIDACTVYSPGVSKATYIINAISQIDAGYQMRV